MIVLIHISIYLDNKVSIFFFFFFLGVGGGGGGWWDMKPLIFTFPKCGREADSTQIIHELRVLP